MKKESIKISKEEMNNRLVHSPSPMHLQACLKGAQIHKNKKKYSRKEKHKKGYE